MKKKVTGIGGVFFKSKDPKAIREWYKYNLGLDVNEYGSTFKWKDDGGNSCLTQWSAFKEDTEYFDPSKKDFMINFRVADLDYLLGELKKEGIESVSEVQEFEYGRFAWIVDPEGNKIELWEPIDGPLL